MNDVRQDQYPTVIREMIRHEHDVTNHRIMWLLVGQGFVINAYVSSKVAPTHAVLSVVGILVSLCIRDALPKLRGARISPVPRPARQRRDFARGAFTIDGVAEE
jgi:hypothetical protein